MKQQVELCGIVGEKPIVKNLSRGYMLTIIKLATNEQFEMQNGAPLSVVVWHTIRLWNEMAYYASLHIQKGDRIKVGATITYSIPKTGERKRITSEIKAHSVTQMNNP